MATVCQPPPLPFPAPAPSIPPPPLLPVLSLPSLSLFSRPSIGLMPQPLSIRGELGSQLMSMGEPGKLHTHRTASSLKLRDAHRCAFLPTSAHQITFSTNSHPHHCICACTASSPAQGGQGTEGHAAAEPSIACQLSHLEILKGKRQWQALVVQTMLSCVHAAHE